MIGTRWTIGDRDKLRYPLADGSVYLLRGTPQVGRALETTRYLECYGGIQTCSLRLVDSSGRSEVLKSCGAWGQEPSHLWGPPQPVPIVSRGRPALDKTSRSRGTVKKVRKKVQACLSFTSLCLTAVRVTWELAFGRTKERLT